MEFSCQKSNHSSNRLLLVMSDSKKKYPHVIVFKIFHITKYFSVITFFSPEICWDMSKVDIKSKRLVRYLDLLYYSKLKIFLTNSKELLILLFIFFSVTSKRWISSSYSSSWEAPNPPILFPLWTLCPSKRSPPHCTCPPYPLHRCIRL